MPTITYQNTAVIIEAPETLLEGLEKVDIKIPFSCRSGICHSCIMQADRQPPPDAQQGLNANQKAQYYFLACRCIPKSNMKINLIGNTDRIQGTVINKQMLNESVLGLWIQIDSRWFPGQYLTIWHDETEGRSYSIASLCDQNQTIELHIKRHDQGLVSSWLHDDIKTGDPLRLSKPAGNCFYTDNHGDKPLLLVGTGTGLAPLYGIVQDALIQGHKHPIYLYAAAGEPSQLYYVDKLRALAAQHSNLDYIPCVRRGATEGIIQQDVIDLVKQRHTDLKNWTVFLCGSPAMIKQLQRHCFFQGVAVNDILIDAFVIDQKV